MKFKTAKKLLKKQMQDSLDKLNSNPLNSSANAKYAYAKTLLINLKILKDSINESIRSTRNPRGT